MNAKLIVGKTYPRRRVIRAFGGIWSREENGWIIPEENTKHAKLLCELNGFEMREIDVNDDFFRPLTLDELRAYRQEKANRKADRLLTKANRLSNEAEKLDAQTKPFISDIAFVTQPITQNAGGRAFQKQRERINGKVDKMFGLMNEVEDLKERAELIRTNVCVKGDAERARQAERDYNDSLIKVGSHIISHTYGTGVIERIYAKSYRVNFDRGFTFSIDKSFVKLV